MKHLLFLQLAFSRAVRAAWSRTFISVKWEDGFIIGCSKKCCKIEAIWFHVDLKFHVKLLVGLFFLIFLSSLFWSFQVFLWEFSESLVLCVTLCVVNNLCSGGFWMGGCFNDLMGHSKDSFYWEPMAAIWKIWGCHFIAGGCFFLTPRCTCVYPAFSCATVFHAAYWIFHIFLLKELRRRLLWLCCTFWQLPRDFFSLPPFKDLPPRNFCSLRGEKLLDFFVTSSSRVQHVLCLIPKLSFWNSKSFDTWRPFLHTNVEIEKRYVW